MNYYRVVFSVQCFLWEDKSTNFSYLCKLSHFVTYWSQNSIWMPRTMWQDGHDQEVMFNGHLLSIPAFQSMFDAQVANTTALLLNSVAVAWLKAGSKTKVVMCGNQVGLY